jgi:mercuric reductase
MVGHTAGEVIHEAAMARCFHAKINDFIDLLHVYPTMAEALKSRHLTPQRSSETLLLRRVTKEETAHNVI